jgi:hypothetical protein
MTHRDEDEATKELETLSTPELVRRVVAEAAELGKAQLDLAVAEARADLRSELDAAEGLGVSAVAAICCANLLLVAAVFALSRWLPGWAAGLAVGGVVGLAAVVAGLLGWGKRVRRPLRRTRRSLDEDVRFTKTAGGEA